MNEKDVRNQLIALIDECKAEADNRWQAFTRLQARYELARSEWCNADRITRRLLKLASDIGLEVESKAAANDNQVSECPACSDR